MTKGESLSFLTQQESTNLTHSQSICFMPFVCSIGTIVGPAIGGSLANPASSSASLCSLSGNFATFPFLLPDLIRAVLFMISITAGHLLLIETYPYLRSWCGSSR